MSTTMHALVDGYLRRLERAARELPRRDRENLLTDIRGHLATGLPSDAGEADVRNLLDDLGPPEDIVAAAQPERSGARRGPREIFALLLLVTGLPPILGWLVGAGLLLWSPLWSARQKLLGLLIWPGGYTAVVGLGVVFSGRSCPVSSGASPGTSSECVSTGPSVWSILAAVLVAAAPLLVAAWLYRAAGRAGT